MNVHTTRVYRNRLYTLLCALVHIAMCTCVYVSIHPFLLATLLCALAQSWEGRRSCSYREGIIILLVYLYLFLRCFLKFTDFEQLQAGLFVVHFPPKHLCVHNL